MGLGVGGPAYLVSNRMSHYHKLIWYHSFISLALCFNKIFHTGEDGAFCMPQFLFVFEFECEWQFGFTQVISITIRPFTLKNIFLILKCPAKLPFSIRTQKFLNHQMAFRPYSSHSAVHTQTQTQTESEAFKTQGKMFHYQEIYSNCSN